MITRLHGRRFYTTSVLLRTLIGPNFLRRNVPVRPGMMGTWLRPVDPSKQNTCVDTCLLGSASKAESGTVILLADPNKHLSTHDFVCWDCAPNMLQNDQFSRES